MSATLSSDNALDPAGVALSLSRQLINVVKVKNILHIEVEIEMIAFERAISSEVNHVDIFKSG